MCCSFDNIGVLMQRKYLHYEQQIMVKCIDIYIDITVLSLPYDISLSANLIFFIANTIKVIRHCVQLLPHTGWEPECLNSANGQVLVSCSAGL